MKKSTIPSNGKPVKPKKPMVTPIVRRIAKRIGAKLLIEPEYQFVGHITFSNGKTTFFRDTNFNINPLGSIEIARDKGYASFFLKNFGYPVPEGRTFFSPKLRIAHTRSIDEGYLYAKGLGFPVIVKPDKRSQGTMVQKVYTRSEYYKTARAILQSNTVFLVEKYCPGNDFRIVVLDEAVISAYQRLPLMVTGDGKSTIERLLGRKQSHFRAIGRDTVIDMHDVRIEMNLRRQKLALSSVLADGQTIRLLDNANLSTGGDAIDLTSTIHGEWVSLAVEITRRMGLRLCGVDIITESITSPPSDYVVLEINGAPGLDNYASIGEAQAQIVEGLYEKVLLALAK